MDLIKVSINVWPMYWEKIYQISFAHDFAAIFFAQYFKGKM